MKKFKPEFILPEMLLRVYPAGLTVPGGLPEGKTTLSAKFADFEFLLEYKNILPAPHVEENNTAFTVVFGSPVLNDRIDPRGAAATAISSAGSPDKDKLIALNGEFLILSFCKKSGTFSVVNDRFTSIPFFYHFNSQKKVLTASPYFSSLWKELGRRGERVFNHEAFFEFLWFQRLIGTKTYDKNTFFLDDASVLTLSGGTLKKERYWQRSYEKSSLQLSRHAEMMAELVKQSVGRKTSDNRRFGHFLSGGMDSRTVLCAFDEPPVCFTSTVTENREFRKAAEIAAAKGAKHIGLELDPEHFGKIYRHSTEVIGGMYNYDHGLFYGFNKVVQEHADVCFHGHGFDYMFQGMYIPGEDVVIGGRHLYLRFMKKLPDDLISYFIANASYRIKHADVWSVVHESRRSSLKEFQAESIREILNNGKKLTDNPIDLWEYLTFHHISRHYSYPNHASIATFAEQRTVSFDNELFDLYLSLPANHRFNGKIEKACLKILNPEIARIWSANTNLPVTASCWTQTAYQIASFIKHRFVPEERKPEWQERTWPSRDDAIRSQKLLKDAVISLSSSGILEQLDFLDIDRIRKDLPKWTEGENIPGFSGDLVQTLLTMGTFLELS